MLFQQVRTRGALQVVDSGACVRVFRFLVEAVCVCNLAATVEERTANDGRQQGHEKDGTNVHVQAERISCVVILHSVAFDGGSHRATWRKFQQGRSSWQEQTKLRTWLCGTANQQPGVRLTYAEPDMA